MGNLILSPMPVPKTNLKRLANIINVVTTLAFVLKLPMFPWIVINLGDTIFSATVLGYSVMTWKYYEALPIMKKTVLTYLVQDFLLSVSSVRILQLLRSFVLSTGALTGALLSDDYSNLTCSILSSVPPGIFSLHLAFTTFSFQTFSKISPATYLSFNHEKARMITLAVNMTAFVTELLSIIWMYGTLCTDVDVALLQALTGLQLHLQSAPPYAPMMVVITCLPRLVYWIVELRHKERSQWSYVLQPSCFSQPLLHGAATENLRRNYDMNIDMSIDGDSADINITIDFESERATAGSYRFNNRNNIVVPEGFVAQNSIIGSRSNAVAPEGFVTQYPSLGKMGNTVAPLGKTQIPQFLDLNVTFAVIVTFTISFLIIVSMITVDQWWIIVYLKDFFVWLWLIYWLHSSEEISGYAMRKLSQNFQMS
jgi:hypothetical protein